MKSKSVKIIACETVLKEAKPFLTPDIETITVESELHANPEKLQIAIQEIVTSITDNTDNIILGYGLCSNAVLGLKANRSTMIIPRVDDCIAICLGSQEAYRSEMRREVGTFFLSRGWIDAKITPIEDFNQMKEKYGKEKASWLMSLIFKHYTRLAYIDMGCPGQEKYIAFAEDAAKQLNLKFETLQGASRLLEQMFLGPWDDSFIVAPPGHSITLTDFKQPCSACSE